MQHLSATDSYILLFGLIGLICLACKFFVAVLPDTKVKPKDPNGWPTYIRSNGTVYAKPNEIVRSRKYQETVKKLDARFGYKQIEEAK
jgi:hypothetical protein